MIVIIRRRLLLLLLRLANSLLAEKVLLGHGLDVRPAKKEDLNLMSLYLTFLAKRRVI